jgi:hypothetical protein
VRSQRLTALATTAGRSASSSGVGEFQQVRVPSRRRGSRERRDARASVLQRPALIPPHIGLRPRATSSGFPRVASVFVRHRFSRWHLVGAVLISTHCPNQIRSGFCERWTQEDHLGLFPLTHSGAGSGEIAALGGLGNDGRAVGFFERCGRIPAGQSPITTAWLSRAARRARFSVAATGPNSTPYWPSTAGNFIRVPARRFGVCPTSIFSLAFGRSGANLDPLSNIRLHQTAPREHC